MKTLLLSGYSLTPEPEESFALKELHGIRIIDWQIRRLKSLGSEVVVVLGGTDSEDLLRKSQLLRYCELVFDTHGEQVSRWTNLQSGLESGPGWSFALDIKHPAPDLSTFKQLRDRYLIDGLNSPSHVYCATPKRSPWLVSRSGRQFIKSTNDINSLEDSRLLLVRLDEGYQDLSI